jgi:signal transduction histidine kinase
MMLGVVAFVMLLVWIVTTWALNHYFNEVGKAIIADDLHEYGVVYDRFGAEGMTLLFQAAGHSERDQAMRLLDPEGNSLLELPIPERPEEPWPDIPTSVIPPADGIEWLRLPFGDGVVVTFGRRRFDDGAEMSFARSNSGDLAAVRQMHKFLFFAMALAAILSIGPVVWFASRVLRPVGTLIGGARRLARGESLDARLEPSEAIPELHEFADAFNETLGRVQTVTEELEAANDQLAHELRTPLARIRGNIENIQNAREATPSMLESAARSIDEIERASTIVRDILSIRAGDSGTMRLNLDSMSLAALVRETADLYSAAVEEKGLLLSLALPEVGTDPTLMLDRQRVQQALCNLLDNAIAFTPAGGKLELALEIDENAVSLHVRDSGPGLSEDDPQKIWRRFMRGSAASASTPGIGLGLSLVRAVARAHRGEAGALNLAEAGADFWIRLPRDSSKPLL